MTATLEHDPLGLVVDCARELVAIWEPWNYPDGHPMTRPMEELRSALMYLDQQS